MKTQLSLTDLAREIQDRARPERKRDFIADSTTIVVDAPANTLAIVSDEFTSEPFKIGEIAHDQIIDVTKIPAPYYRRMMKEAPELLGSNIRTWFDKYPAPRMVRTLDGSARALLSDKYARMDDEAFANIVLPVISEVPGAEVISTAITEEKTFIKFVSPRFEREVKVGDVVQFGMSFSNSEVGRGRLQGSLLAYQLKCLNGMVMPDESWGAAHLGGSHSKRDLREVFQLDTVAADAKATLLKLRDFARELMTEANIDRVVAKMKALTTEELKQPTKAVEVLAAQHSLVEGEKESILSHLIKGGDLSLWGLQNAVTAAAQDEGLSYTRATELEMIGGKMLTLSRSQYSEIMKEAA